MLSTVQCKLQRRNSETQNVGKFGNPALSRTPTLGPDLPAVSCHLISSIKGEVKKKHIPFGPDFFLLLSPLDRARSVLLFRAMCSVAGPCDPVVWVFSTSGFHRSFATKPVSSETSKAERRSVGDHSSIRDS